MGVAGVDVLLSFHHVDGEAGLDPAEQLGQSVGQAIPGAKPVAPSADPLRPKGLLSAVGARPSLDLKPPEVELVPIGIDRFPFPAVGDRLRAPSARRFGLGLEDVGAVEFVAPRLPRAGGRALYTVDFGENRAVDSDLLT